MEKEYCVYFFLNDFTNKRKKRKKIHKVISNDFFVINELTNIKKIQEHRMHFYVCENSSEIKIMELKEDMNSLDLCNHVKKDNTILLKFEDREIIQFKNYIKALSSPKKHILCMIDFYRHLLDSINLLVSQQMVHNNINFDSIVVDNRHYPLITHFSLSIDISRTDIELYMRHFIIEFDTSYLEWPLEFHILSYLLTNKLNSLSSYNIENIINSVIDNHTILKTFGDTIVSSYKQEALHYFKKYVNRSYEYILTDMLQYYGTWDNYALSIMFLRMLIQIHKTVQVKNKFIILFMKLLVCNIHLNPINRLSIATTTNKFEAILESLEPKDYMELF